MSKNIILIAGSIIISSLILAGALYLQPKVGGPASVADSAKFSFATAIGKAAPDFTLPDFDGNQVSLNGLKGKNVILFFNEGLMCYPACLNQVVELAKLNGEDTVAYSVVADSQAQWINAQKDLPYLKGAKVLFDSGAQVSRLYNTLSLPSSMHKGVYPGHTYYLIDKEGVVRYTLDDPYMANRNKELEEALKKL